MPQQLIYTSAPRGLVPGRSGHCTVARSESMGESLMLRLEQLSYYTHLSLAGGTNRPIYSYREVRIRSDSFYVLSRIDDSGLDFTGRTNFIAHHLVFTSDEILKYKCPAIILRDWEGFKNSWGPERHPELLKNENENWDSIKFSKETKPSGKATTWEEKTGDAINGYGILEASRSGLAFQVDGVLEDTILAMFAESVALLEVRDGGRNFQATAWRYFFTTSLQEQDNQADFRWCCFHQDNPAKSRFAEGAYKSLLKVVPPSDLTEDQKDFAKNGGSAPTFVEQPASDSQRTVGDELILILKAKATGCPTPKYQWMEVDLVTKEVVPLPNKTGVDLVVDTKTFGLRLYQLRASNSSGECLSEVAKVEVNNRKEAIATPPQWNRSPEATPNNPLILKTSDKTDRRKKEWTDSYRAPVEPGSRFGKTLAWICVIVVVGLFLYFGFNYLAGRDSYKITSKTPPSGWSLYRIGSVKTNDQSFTLETNSPNFAQKLFKTRTPNTAFTLTAVVPKFEEKQESFLFAGTTNLTIATQPDNTPTYCETTLIDLPDDSMSRGIMIRSFADAINSNARFLFVGVSGGSIVVSQRDEVRGKTKDNNVGNFKGIQTLSLRFIEREGDTCDAQYKLKGRDWTLITNTFKLSGSPLIGVAIASRNESNAGTFTGRFAFNGNLTTSTSTTAATNVPPKQGLLASVKDKLRNAFKGSAPTSAPKGSSTSIVSTVTVVAATNQEVVPSGSIETEPKTTPPTEPPKPAEGGSKTLPEGWVVTGIGGLTNINVTYFEKGGAPYPDLANMELTTGKSKGFTEEGDVCLFVHKEFSYLSMPAFRTSSIFLTNKSGYSLPPGNIRGIMARSGLEATANFLFIGIREANIVVHQRKAGAVTNTISSALDILTLSIGLFGKSTALEAQYTAKGMPNPVPAPDIFSLPKDQAKYIGWAIMTEGGAERVTARFTITK